MDKKKVLIVEDEEIIALELSTRLERLGYDVCSNASNYKDAIDKALNHDPDLIFMDIRIEGEFDGIETAKKILEKKKIPIIYLTAYADKETIDRAKETVPYGYLVKPVQERDLNIALEMALHKARIEKELDKAKESLLKERDLFSQGPVILTVWAPEKDWPVIFVSENLKQILGYSPEEWMDGKFRFTQIIHYQDVERVTQTVNYFKLKGIDTYELSYRVKNKDGNYLWFYDFGRLERDSTGEVKEIRGYMFDQTQLKETTRELEESEIKYRTVANYTYNWEYWRDEQNRFIYISPSVHRITGYFPEEFFENPDLIDDIVYFEDRHIWGEHLHEVEDNTSDEKVRNLEFRIFNKCGDIRWIHHTCRHIYENNKCLGIRASNRDITKQKEAERKLLNNTIEVEEYERTRFSRELHDGLGPMLAVVKLYLEWIGESNDVEKIKGLAEKSLTNIKTAIQTTRELSHGISPIILKDQGLVRALKHFIGEINDSKQLNIEFYTNVDMPFESTIEISIYRITTELINNTLKYAKATQIDISLMYKQNLRLVTLNFQDNGIGFDITQSNSSTTGHGLVNIKSRVKALNGNIRFESILSQGVFVHIEIPV